MFAVQTLTIEPNERVPYAVRYEDDDVAVVDKPPGVVSQPGKGHAEDSLLNGLFARWGPRLQNMGEARDWGLMHRLDREASGLLLVALKPAAWEGLRRAFAERTIRKYYLAIVKGTPSKPEGTINRPIAEEMGEKKRARISPGGKPSLTAYRVLGSGAGASLLECRTVTGRLHQVRVHLDSIHCPILGDGLYGTASSRARTPRLCLHAHRIVFEHPATGERVDVQSKPPKDMRRALRELRIAWGGDEQSRDSRGSSRA